MGVLGVSIANGVLYLAALSEAEGSNELLGSPTADPRRILPSDSLPSEKRILDLRDRFRQDLRSIQPAAVSLVATRKYSDLSYKVALKRIPALSAVMIACAEENVLYCEEKTDDIGRLTQVPAKNLSSISPALFGYADQPMYWTAGLSDAFGAAACRLRALNRAN